ncbi:MAG: DUF805 domain-containing protein [Candidatus Nanopelagicales bacterium]|nr:DUF805 domain-containing protein [Candidatus Nanopelagicales bacterium]
MGFGQAISTCLRKYVVFEGRARRSEFWFWVLFVVIVVAVAAIVDQALGLRLYQFDTVQGSQSYSFASSIGILSTIASLALLLPGISVSVRRLHDSNNSGWWWWLNLLNFLCGLGAIILVFAFYIRPSDVGENKYGPAPS